jgi:hypothetical protein
MNHSIVFVHIGTTLPSYLNEALLQSRMFNHCNIFLIANREALVRSPIDTSLNITFVPCESIGLSQKHQTFHKVARLERNFREGFWYHTTERFYYLESLIKKYDLENIFHLENDNLLYVTLQKLMPIFRRNYQGIAATFDDDNRCVPGFMYIKNYESIEELTQMINDIFQYTDMQCNDMEMLAIFKKRYQRNYIDTLPIVTCDYPVPLQSLIHKIPKNTNDYFNHIDDFNSVFDAAALGQYLGGIDPENSHGNSTVGFINETCVFNPSYYKFQWIKDSANRRVPHLISKRNATPVNNLHIHSKNLSAFMS